MTERVYSEVQSVARAAKVLLTFADVDYIGPTDLAARTGLHKSVTHRLLATLASNGLLAHDQRTGLYSLSPMMAQLNPPEGANSALVRVARPYLQRLADSTGETISLCVVDGARGLCIDVIDSKQSMRFTVHTGETFPLHAGCIGKVMLAFQSDKFIEGLIRQKALMRYTENTITDPDALRAELAKVRRQGFGFSDAEITPGSRSVGAPVYDANGAVNAGLVISAPAFRMPDSAVDNLVLLVQEEAENLSRELGYRPRTASATKIENPKEPKHVV